MRLNLNNPEAWKRRSRRLGVLALFGCAIGLMMLPLHYPGFVRSSPPVDFTSLSQPRRESRPEAKERMVREARQRVARYKDELLKSQAGVPETKDEAHGLTSRSDGLVGDKSVHIPRAKPVRGKLPKDFVNPQSPAHGTRVVFRKATPPDEPNPFQEALKE